MCVWVCICARSVCRAGQCSLRHCGQLWLSRLVAVVHILPSAGLKSWNEISTQAHKYEQCTKNEALRDLGIEATSQFWHCDLFIFLIHRYSITLANMKSVLWIRCVIFSAQHWQRLNLGNDVVCVYMSDQGHKSWSNSRLPSTHLFSQTLRV